jgi:hypothetical protein
MMKTTLLPRPIGLALGLLIAVACSSGTNPTAVPSTSPSTSPTTLAPAPGSTPAATSCPLGYGTGKFSCQGDIPGLLPQLQNAIDKLTVSRPDLFDLNNPPSDHGYLVRDQSGFYTALIGTLQTMGMCGQTDYVQEILSIKADNTYSENYKVLTSQSRIRWDAKSYVNTCTPANFPLAQGQAVARVVVSLYGVQCPDGDGPNAALKQVPAGCRGSATATPKDAVGDDVPWTQHGGVTWYLQAGDGNVVTYWTPDASQPFNVLVYGIAVGEFSLCATVDGKTGCMNGTVTPGTTR